MPTTPVTVAGREAGGSEPVDEPAHVGERDVGDGPMPERRDDVLVEPLAVERDRARASSADCGSRSSDAGAQVREPVAGELGDGERRGRRAVRLAALVVDLERAELGDRVRLRARLEPVAPHLAAEPERGVVDRRAVRERALVEAGDAAVAADRRGGASARRARMHVSREYPFRGRASGGSCRAGAVFPVESKS